MFDSCFDLFIALWFLAPAHLIFMTLTEKKQDKIMSVGCDI